MSEARIGVFVCHCGSNIAGVVDVPRLVEYARALPRVAFAQDNLYTCSSAGRAEIVDAIAKHALDRVIVASCTPRTHEPLFRATCEQAGLNPYLFELVNIRDQCSWVHMQEPERATEKAEDLVRMGVARAALLEPKSRIRVPVTPTALVIGGGVAGLTAATSLANHGVEVTVVERETEVGGALRSLNRLYPTNEDAQAFIGAKVEQARAHPDISLVSGARVTQVRGFVGNYEVDVERDGEQSTLSVGAIVVATGARELRPDGLYAYDGQRAITQGELERKLSQPGWLPSPTLRSVTMIQCVGARDEDRAYCSRTCCLTAVKNALLLKEADASLRVYILYRDMMAYGVREEALYRQARGRGVIFISYDPGSPPVVADGGVSVRDELLGQVLDIPTDLVVLSTPAVPHSGAAELAQMLKVPLDRHGFFLEAHVKLRPLDFATDGIFVCGSARWPCTVSDAVTQAYGAAARAAALLSKGEMEVEPIVSVVEASKCLGCGLCETLCPYQAIVVRGTNAGRKAETVAASCKGCGVCAAACPAKAISIHHYTDEQVLAQVDAFAEVAR